jgi:DNA-binding PadR family transcriptional regulator
MSIRHALLALLSEGPKYGLQLRQDFEARTGEVWPLNVGQVYTTLQRLERDGLVESHEEEDAPHRGFQITDAGGVELDAWLHAPAGAEPPRDELVIKVMVALAVPGVDVPALIQAHRRNLVELMQRYTRLKEDVAEHEVPVALVMDAEIYRIDGLIRWLDAADIRLRRSPLPTSDVATPPVPALVRRARRLGARS